MHGDWGWRNLGISKVGTIVVFDFEHSAISHPFVDLAKLWDLDLLDRRARDAFLPTYADLTTIDLTELTPAMLAFRLWAVAGIFSYCLKHDDPGFFHRGEATLTRLEAELLSNR